MKLGIMQPYFFPYLGYISLLKNTDVFILLDNVQFMKNGWIERNRILKPNPGWQYINVPLVRHSSKESIQNILINNTLDWRKRILAQLHHYKKKSPYYNQVISLINRIFKHQYRDIVSLNRAALLEVCEYLDIQKDIPVFSRMKLEIESVRGPDEWALNICKALGNVTEYWNPPGGKSFYDKGKFENNGMKLFFHEPYLEEYDQKRDSFEPGLSIIDVMMFNSPREINTMLDQYELL